MPRLTDLSQLRFLLRGLSYYREFVPTLVERLRRVTDLLKQHLPYCFTPEMEAITRDVLEPYVLIYPDWDAYLDMLQDLFDCSVTLARVDSELTSSSSSLTVRFVPFRF